MQEIVLYAHKLKLKKSNLRKKKKRSNKIGPNRRLRLFCTQVLVYSTCKGISLPLSSTL